jgi:hypothetical protein
VAEEPQVAAPGGGTRGDSQGQEGWAQGRHHRPITHG